METALTRTELIEALPERERKAYFKHTASGAQPASPDLNARMFKLYLTGKTLDQIQCTNKAFTLGMVVQAKIEGDWDARKAIYQKELLDNVKERVKMTQLEAIHFVSDQLSFAHEKFRAAYMKYVETGDEGALGELGVKNLKQYKEALDLLMQLTGQDNTRKVEGKVEHTHTVAPAPVPEREVIEAQVIPTTTELLGLLDTPEGK